MEKRCYLIAIILGNIKWAEMGVGCIEEGDIIKMYCSPSRLPIHFKIFPPLQSLRLAIQVEGCRPNSLVVRKVIFLKVWFHFRMKFLELRDGFFPPHPLLTPN